MAQEVAVFPEEHRLNFFFYRVVGPRHTLAFAPIRAWLDDEARPGLYTFGQHWLASEGNFSPRDCIEVAITDEAVAFEFKLAWT
jgi:hypothetical protein